MYDYLYRLTSTGVSAMRLRLLRRTYSWGSGKRGASMPADGSLRTLSRAAALCFTAHKLRVAGLLRDYYRTNADVSMIKLSTTPLREQTAFTYGCI